MTQFFLRFSLSNFGTGRRQRGNSSAVPRFSLFNFGTGRRQRGNSSAVPRQNDREPERGIDLLESSIRDLSFTNPSDVSRLPAVSKLSGIDVFLHNAKRSYLWLSSPSIGFKKKTLFWPLPFNSIRREKKGMPYVSRRDVCLPFSRSLLHSLFILPERCMSAILSFITPRDVSRLATVSKVFKTAAYSDAVWNTFLPPQCYEILPRAVTPLQFASKRELYFLLCDSILIDGGRKLFWLERSTAKIGYMLSARALSIDWGDDHRFWRWVCRDDSRFDELAELLSVCWLRVWGTMDCRLLSADTEYRVVFVLKLNAHSSGLDGQPIRFSVKTSEVEEMRSEQFLARSRNDGRWMEVIAGEFRVREEEDLDYDSFHIRFEMKEVERLNLKTGLLVEGVKVEPKSR